MTSCRVRWQEYGVRKRKKGEAGRDAEFSLTRLPGAMG
jgi:hypothetical protein